MIDRLIEDERGRDRLLAFISRRALPFRATVVDGRPRSTDQNRLQWQWASEAASQLEDTTARELQLEWKARFGAPLLAEEDGKFADLWALMERKLSYSERVQWMEFMDISRLLSVKGFARFLDEIFRTYTQEGIELTDPEEGRYGPKIGSRMDRGGAGRIDPDICEEEDSGAPG